MCAVTHFVNYCNVFIHTHTHNFVIAKIHRDDCQFQKVGTNAKPEIWKTKNSFLLESVADDSRTIPRITVSPFSFLLSPLSPEVNFVCVFLTSSGQHYASLWHLRVMVCTQCHLRAREGQCSCIRIAYAYALHCHSLLFPRARDSTCTSVDQWRCTVVHRSAVARPGGKEKEIKRFLERWECSSPPASGRASCLEMLGALIPQILSMRPLYDPLTRLLTHAHL